MLWKILDVPVGIGAGREGCQSGPDALRDAGLFPMLRRLGHYPIDLGAVRPKPIDLRPHGNPAIRALAEVAAWTVATAQAAHEVGGEPGTIFLGGDHSISAGTISGLARRADASGRPLFVLWVDAHPDFHTLESTVTGNLHGVPLAYVAGRPGFAPWFPALTCVVDPRRICTLGLRDIDAGECDTLHASGVTVHDMAAIDRHGVVPLARAFLDRVAAENGRLHVSFDVDVLDPSFAPAVGTAVPGGLTFMEARLLMETLHDSGRLTSLDVVELNPALDVGGHTARIVIDLLASLMGEGVMSRERMRA